MDYYRVLQVRRDADPEVIEKAYKALCMKHHPDRRGTADGPAATRRMQRLNEAYEVLSDPGLRATYDAGLRPEHGGGEAWERFLSDGLVGLFTDWLRTRG